VKRIAGNCITCTIVSGGKHHKGKEVAIPRIALNIGADDCGFEFKRVQFPLIPSYAMTITKSQGQSIHQLGVYLPTDTFAHGQLYTAISRATSRYRIKFLSWRKNKVRNIVLKSVLI
jgi:ATP-dependent DNA helicase PIF1